MSTGTAPASWGDGDQTRPIPKSYNVAPTQDVPMVRFLVREPNSHGELTPGFARWGLIPRWFRKPTKEWKASTINARIETVQEAPSFRDAYRSGRCIVPMAGYYEWSTLTGKKEAYYVRPAGNEPGLLVLGLWTEARLPDFSGNTVAILTEDAVGAMASLHDRQPVIVDAEGAKQWLDGEPIDAIRRQDPAKRHIHKVGPAVGSWRASGPDLIRPDPTS